MFEYMGDRISNAIKNIKGMGRITEDNIQDAIKEIRMALLEADVNYEVVKEFTKNVKEKALGQNVEKNLKPEELFIKIVKDELISLLGENYLPLETTKNPTIIAGPPNFGIGFLCILLSSFGISIAPILCAIFIV